MYDVAEVLIHVQFYAVPNMKLCPWRQPICEASHLKRLVCIMSQKEGLSRVVGREFLLLFARRTRSVVISRCHRQIIDVNRPSTISHCTCIVVITFSACAMEIFYPC